MKLPAGLSHRDFLRSSASLREGATRLAMMGDQSQSKRGDVELKMFFPCRQLRGNYESGAINLALLPGGGLPVWGSITQGGIADARRLVGQGTGRLAVIGAALHSRRPGAQAIQADILAYPNQAKYPRQRVLVVACDNYACLVPFVEDEDYFFLRTIIPSRKATRDYLNQGETDAEN